MPLFDRIVHVSIGPAGQPGFGVQDFNISFTVVKTDTTSANSCIVKIRNLAKDGRQQIRETDHTVVLKAGYLGAEGLKQIYTGQVTNVTHSFTPPDWLTRVESGDGIYHLREKRVSLSYAAGAPVKTALKDLITASGLTSRGLPSNIPSDEYAQGFSFSGPLREAMDKVCIRLGLEWSIQSGEIQVLKKRGHVQKEACVLDYESGLLRPPEPLNNQGQKLSGENEGSGGGFRVHSLLLPTLEPGHLVSLQSRTANGFYRVDKVTHQGSNLEGDSKKGNDFMSTLEVSPMKES